MPESSIITTQMELWHLEMDHSIGDLSGYMQPHGHDHGQQRRSLGIPMLPCLDPTLLSPTGASHWLNKTGGERSAAWVM